MIIPDRSTGPRSHELTMSLFNQAVVPAFYRSMNSDNVVYIEMELNNQLKGLPLSIAWQKGNEDEYLREILRLLNEHKRELTDKL